MKHLSHIRFVLFLLIAGAISARAQYVSVDFDKQCDFTAYKTYAWTTGTPAKNPVLAQRITEGVDSKLTAKGLRKVEPGSNPDLIVLYHAAAGADTQINTTNSDGYNWGRTWNGGADTPTTGAGTYPAVELTIDIGDAKTKKLLWLGSGVDTRSSKLPLTEKSIDKILEKMFKKFPPPAK
jgi:hypothetical protein